MSPSPSDDLRDQSAAMNHSPLSVLLMDFGADDRETAEKRRERHTDNISIKLTSTVINISSGFLCLEY